MDRLADRAQRLREILHRVSRRYVARLVMHFGDAQIIARDEAVEDFGEEAPLLDAEAAHNTEIDGDEPSVTVGEQIALVHVGMKEAVAQRVAQKRLQDGGAERRQVVARRLPTRNVGERNALDP